MIHAERNISICEVMRNKNGKNVNLTVLLQLYIYTITSYNLREYLNKEQTLKVSHLKKFSPNLIPRTMSEIWIDGKGWNQVKWNEIIKGFIHYLDITPSKSGWKHNGTCHRMDSIPFSLSCYTHTHTHATFSSFSTWTKLDETSKFFSISLLNNKTIIFFILSYFTFTIFHLISFWSTLHITSQRSKYHNIYPYKGLKKYKNLRIMNMVTN